jgi:N-acetylglucosaminyldiphosphoundecaprenol N-acetyl-beta-D-mannosaminyltransferase
MKNSILGSRVDPTSYANALQQVMTWAKRRESRYVCAANVHMLMEAYDSPEFQRVVNAADLVTPDGMPLVWTLRWLGFRQQERVYGPTLTMHVLESANKEGIAVGFYGGTPITLEKLKSNLLMQYPGLNIAYSYAPPFRPLTMEEDEEVTNKINASEALILFVGLGCPKQEWWMAAHRGRIQAVMLGVGAAFDFHAGIKPQAPHWMQRIGLEWLFRLSVEPGRLWRRYLIQNPRFIYLVLKQFMRGKDG